MSRSIVQDGNSARVDSRPKAVDVPRPGPFATSSAPLESRSGGPHEEVGPTGQPAPYVAALLSLSAAFIHGLVVPEHFAEWWGYGVFFLAAAVLQAVFALVVIRRASRAVLVAGIAGNLAIVAVWVISRTVGVPFFGPGAGEIEEIATHDVVATAAEIALVVLLVRVVQARHGSSRPITAEW